MPLQRPVPTERDRMNRTRGQEPAPGPGPVFPPEPSPTPAPPAEPPEVPEPTPDPGPPVLPPGFPDPAPDPAPVPPDEDPRPAPTPNVIEGRVYESVNPGNVERYAVKGADRVHRYWNAHPHHHPADHLPVIVGDQKPPCAQDLGLRPDLLQGRLVGDALR